jgi:hypothetical protein
MTDFTTFHVKTDDGLTLYGRDYPPSAPDAVKLPIVCLPGLKRVAPFRIRDSVDA